MTGQSLSIQDIKGSDGRVEDTVTLSGLVGPNAAVPFARGQEGERHV